VTRTKFGRPLWILAAASIVQLLCVTAWTEALNIGSPNWGLQDVLKIAETNSYGLERSQSKINEMHAATHVAFANYLPYVGLQSTISSNQFFFSQKIYDGGAALATIRMAGHREKGAEAEKRIESLKVRDQVIEAYHSAIHAKRASRFLDEDAAKIASAMQRVEKQFKYRVIGRDALLRAKVQIRKNRSERFGARDLERESIRVLSRLTHLPNFSPDWLADDLQSGQLPKPAFAERPADPGQALRSLPQRELLQISSLMLEDEKNIALATDRINVSLNASYGLGPQAPNFSVGYVYAVGFQYGLSLTIPFSSAYSLHAKKKVFAERQYELERDTRILDDDLQFDYHERVDSLQRDWVDLQAIREELAASEAIWKEADANFQLGISSPDLWFEAAENVRQWKLRQLQKIRSYLTQFDRVKELVQQM